MQDFPGAFKPPAEHRQQIDSRREQRDSNEQHADIAEKNNDCRKQVALLRDVGLPCFENVPGQRDVKGVGCADQQMEPDFEPFPIPDEMA